MGPVSQPFELSTWRLAFSLDSGLVVGTGDSKVIAAGISPCMAGSRTDDKPPLQAETPLSQL